jgi:hypothetical protein
LSILCHRSKQRLLRRVNLWIKLKNPSKPQQFYFSIFGPEYKPKEDAGTAEEI